MKNLTIFPLHDYRMKYAGFVLALACAVVWATGLRPLPPGYFQYGAVLGLYLMAASRQRNESLRVRTMRYIAYKASFLFLAGFLLALVLMDLLFGGFSDGKLLLTTVTGLAFYHLVFHFLLYFGPEEAIDTHTVKENIRENRSVYTTVSVVVLIVILLFAFLGRN